jgi:hypothetical protein
MAALDRLTWRTVAGSVEPSASILATVVHVIRRIGRCDALAASPACQADLCSVVRIALIMSGASVSWTTKRGAFWRIVVERGARSTSADGNAAASGWRSGHIQRTGQWSVTVSTRDAAPMKQNTLLTF